MAYTNVQSGVIPEGTQYYSGKLPLGDYTFYLQFDATSGTPTVVARCDYPSGIRGAAQKTLPEGTQIQQWSIEANETEASVYATLAKAEAHGSVVDTSEVDKSVLINPNYVYKIYAYTFEEVVVADFWHYTLNSGSCLIARLKAPLVVGSQWIFCSKSPFTILRQDFVRPDEIISAGTISHNGISYYRFSIRTADDTDLNSYYSDMVVSQASYNGQSVNPNEFDVAHLLLNGSIEYESQEIDNKLIARFAINLGDAGGYPGGGGGWTQPGDWNPDPTTTLHLTVNGALSGRHNDPLNDTSFSYVPADKATVKDYGSGGDGGNGGGGGAGASTIIVRQFATNKANSKDILALAKRHGYGSGGGKGGKGGDGCILIYY